tara:strand:- start:196 stop:864 length:669 start_codon:yes stop_codon:yes gene_type:complete
MSIISPRSFCFKCKNKIPFYNNIPILSYIIQKGKCAKCHNKFSYQYPLIELLMGIIFVLSYHIIYPLNSIEPIFFSIMSGILICIAVIDYNFFIIPLSLLLFGIIINIPFIIFFSSNSIYTHLYGSLFGLGYLSIVFILTWFFTKKQPLGFGDLQLIILLGIWLGPFKVLLTIFFGSILGLIYLLIISLFSGYPKNPKLPFGTFLCIASIIIYLIPTNWEFI